jgi:protein phosphatase 2C family protein 2/3
MSRCLGDLDYKKERNLQWDRQMLTSCPDIKIHRRNSEAEFIVVACDGIWECMNS